MNIASAELRSLELQALEIRESIINMLMHAGSGHTAGSLGMVEVFVALYFKLMKHNPANPTWANRDRLILSNGHINPVLYATMAHAGYFNVSELLTLRKFGSRLQGHPHREFLPFLETSSGPLGCGLSQAIGMATFARSVASEHKYYFVLLGDGELNEGQVWEAMMLLGKSKLPNVILIIDRNRIQIDGNTEDVMPLEPLASKLESFNLHVESINGNDLVEVCNTIENAKLSKINGENKSTVIIANTVAGKGIESIEGDFKWHGKAPSLNEGEVALTNLRTLYGRLTND